MSRLAYFFRAYLLTLSLFMSSQAVIHNIPPAIAILLKSFRRIIIYLFQPEVKDIFTPVTKYLLTQRVKSLYIILASSLDKCIMFFRTNYHEYMSKFTFMSCNSMNIITRMPIILQ